MQSSFAYQTYRLGCNISLVTRKSSLPMLCKVAQNFIILNNIPLVWSPGRLKNEIYYTLFSELYFSAWYT